MAGTDRFAWTAPRSGSSEGTSLLVAWHEDPVHVGAVAVVEPGPPVVVGRGSDLLGPGALAHPALSGRHAALEARPDGLHVRDLGSANGLLVDGVRRAEAVVPPQGVLSLPPCHLVVLDRVPGPIVRLGALASRGAWLAELAAVAPRWPRERAVVLLGETGTGKSAAARALHDARPRSGPFVRVQLGALQPSTWRAELAGWRRGAFTGADRDGEGLLARAAGGTLFLDELGYVDAEIQAALLTLLDGERTWRRIGDPADRPLDAHVVGAADRDLRDGFLAPLWHRLAGAVVEIPPLRRRREDVLLLAGLPFTSSRVARKLLLFGWPGNVRQLERVAAHLRDAPSAEDAVDGLLAAEGAAVPPAPPAAGAPSARWKRADRPDPAEIRARLAAGATRAELAREWGVHKSQITRWLARDPD